MNAYLSKSWETVHGMIDAFFVLLPKLILAIVVFVLFWFVGTIVNPRSVRVMCLSWRTKEEISMARKVGQIIARGDRRWLIRVWQSWT